jgi:hypothetical protein
VHFLLISIMSLVILIFLISPLWFRLEGVEYTLTSHGLLRLRWHSLIIQQLKSNSTIHVQYCKETHNVSSDVYDDM